MSLQLDPRRLAMLQAMGITLWLPETAAAPVAAADPGRTVAATAPTPTRPEAAPVAHSPAAGAPAAGTATTAPAAPVRPSPRRPAAAAQTTPPPAPAETAAVAAAATTWQLAPAVHLYPQAAGEGTGGPWLILLESVNPTTPLAGAVGQLLGKMLQALGLDTHPQVWLAVLQRPGSSALPIAAGMAGSLAPVDWQPLQPCLARTIAQVQPARVLLLGQKVAQTVLERSEPVGQLRQQRHVLHGIAAAVSYDPSFLLRTAQPRRYKGETWDDLRFAAQLGGKENRHES